MMVDQLASHSSPSRPSTSHFSASSPPYSPSSSISDSISSSLSPSLSISSSFSSSSTSTLSSEFLCMSSPSPTPTSTPISSSPSFLSPIPNFLNPHSFLSLPPELRNSIYHHLFQSSTIEDLGLCPKPIRTKNYHPSITMTSRQIRHESISILRLSTTLHFRIGWSGAPCIPRHVLSHIRTVRIPAHRLKTLDTAGFERLETLVLDVAVEPAVWRLLPGRAKERSHDQQGGGVGTGKDRGLTDVSDMIHLSMALGVFEHSWDVEKVWRDKERRFRMLCWVSSWLRGGGEAVVKPVLVDIDRGVVLAEGIPD